jgi:hypothetical protein
MVRVMSSYMPGEGSDEDEDIFDQSALSLMKEKLSCQVSAT